MTFARSVVLLIQILLLCTAGCRFSTGDTVTQAIGPEGGTLRHPSGAVLRVPEGALATRVELSISLESSPGVSPRGAQPLGEAFLLGPEGQTFQRPVELELPFDLAWAPSGTDANTVRVYSAPARSNDFTGLDSTVDGSAGRVVARTLHFSVVVAAMPFNPNALFITTGFLSSGEEGTPHGATFTATGGTAPYTWTLAAGTLPPGLTLSATGALTGTPSAAGLYAFSVRVEEAGGQRVEKPFTLEVVPAGWHPVPRVFSVAPSTLAVGSGNTQVVLTGLDFVNGCTAFIGATPLATLFDSPTQVQAVVPSSFLASAGTLQLGVTNPGPGGGPSNTVTLVVGGATGLSVSSVNPAQVVVDSGPQVITVTGTGFDPGSAVTLNGNTLATTYVSPMQLTATLPASTLSRAGAFTVRVSNQLIGGGVSNGVTFQVVNQAPVITAMSPAELPAGYPTVQVTLTGSYFAPGGVASVGADSFSTQVLSPTEAIITVPADSLVNPGNFQLFFVNPQPGGGTSAPFPFRIVSLPPPLQLAATASYPTHLTVDDVSVYWTEQYGHTVNKAPINGGPVSQLVDPTRARSPKGVATALCNVYWANTGIDDPHATNPVNGSIQAVPVNGGTPGQVATYEGFYPKLLRYDRATQQLFWTEGGGDYDTLQRSPVGGGAPLRTFSRDWLQALELDDTYLYVVSRGTGNQRFFDGSVVRVNKDGSASLNLATSQHDPRGLAVGGGRVYWATDGEIRSVAITGAGGVSQVAKDQGTVSSLAIDAVNLYWATSSDIRMMPLAGGPLRILAHGLNSGPRELKVDGANLYWVTDTNKVLQLAKPGGAGGPPATGACANNPGSAFPVQLTNTGGWGGIVSDGTYVYWTDNRGSQGGNVYKLPVSGGVAPTTLASGQESPRSPWLWAGQLFWVNYGGPTTGRIMVINASGTPAATVYASGQEYVDSLAIDSSGAWWTSSGNFSLWHNKQTVFNYSPAWPTHIALDATHVYWHAQGTTWKMPKAGGAPAQVMQGDWEMVAWGGFLYWIGSGGSILKMDLTSGAVVTLATGQASARGLVVDGGDLYWITDGVDGARDDGRIKRLRNGAAAPVVLAEAQPQPAGLAVDAQNVYWLNAGTYPAPPVVSGGVMKLAKSGLP